MPVKKSKKASNYITSIFFVLVFILIGLVHITHFDLTRLPLAIRVVESGSMQPRIPVGSLIITRQIGPNQIRSGNVISFKVNNEILTHRIISVSKNDKGVKLETKGDNSTSKDPGFISEVDVLGKLVLVIPYLGYVLLFFQRPAGLLLIACVIVGTLMIHNIVMLIKKERKYEKTPFK